VALGTRTMLLVQCFFDPIISEHQRGLYQMGLL
jgi:hypothetical protein